MTQREWDPYTHKHKHKHKHTHARAHARARAHTHTRTHARARAQAATIMAFTWNFYLVFWISLSLAAIVTCLLGLFVAIGWELGAAPEELERFMLVWGDGIHPVQWVTSMFLHGGVLHLAGNMVFLWVFGLVVEGKLGTAKFVPLYLGIGVAQCTAVPEIFHGDSRSSAPSVSRSTTKVSPTTPAITASSSRVMLARFA